MNRRAFLAASLITLPTLAAVAPRAEALTARLLTLDELCAMSTHVVVGTAGESRSVWEDLPSGRRIVTYTRVAVERVISGSPGAELWVRTLGGVVGHIGQAVPGEVQLPYGSRSLLFLAEVHGVVVVAAMSQGHYPIVIDHDGVSRLAPSPDSGMLVPRPGPSISARERLIGASLDDASALVRSIRRSRDGKK